MIYLQHNTIFGNKVQEFLSRRHNPLTISILLFITFLSYANSLNNGFVEDDHYIIELRHNSASFHEIINAITREDKLFDQDTTPYYRPINRISYFIDDFLFGLRPTGYHAISIILHAICTVLIYIALLQLQCKPIVSFMTALLFAIHPINAETVNFISARNNILAGVFVFASLLTFLLTEKRKTRYGYIFSGFFYFLGALSKETALMLLPVLILFKLYSNTEPRSSNILKWDVGFILPHFLFLGLYLFLRLYAIDRSFIEAPMTGFTARVKNLFYIIPAYISLIVVPVRLTFYHQAEIPDSYQGLLLPLLVKWLMFIVALLYIVRSRNRTMIFGALWLMINFIPVSNLLPIPSASMAERYMYLPSIGIFLIVSEAAQSFALYSRSKRALSIILLIVIIVLIYRTVTRNADWKNDLALSRSTVGVTPSYAPGHYEFAYASYLQGDDAMASDEFKRYLALAPHGNWASWAYYYLGVLSIEMRDVKRGQEYFSSALQEDPWNAKARYALALLLSSNHARAEKEYAVFLKSMSLSTLPHIPEVNSRIIGSGYNHPRSEAARTTLDSSPLSGRWTLLFHFKSGTSMYYDRMLMQKKGNMRIVLVRQRMSKLDIRTYGMKLIRFPLINATEGLFLYNIDCSRDVYKIKNMEFRDRKGNVLGTVSPEREAYDQFEYIMPQSSVKLLANKVCGDFMQRIP